VTRIRIGDCLFWQSAKRTDRSVAEARLATGCILVAAKTSFPTHPTIRRRESSSLCPVVGIPRFCRMRCRQRPSPLKSGWRVRVQWQRSSKPIDSLSAQCLWKQVGRIRETFAPTWCDSLPKSQSMAKCRFSTTRLATAWLASLCTH